MMYEVQKNGGLHTGGLNFDAKVRRGSFKAEDLAIAHIAGMDSFARGADAAARMIADKALDKLLDERYAGWQKGLGASIRGGKESFKSLEAAMLDAATASASDFGLGSGKQEYLESIVNKYL
jgi:xylose isomerase